MDKLIFDLHALKVYLELNSHWFLAAQIDQQIQELTGSRCHFCLKPLQGVSLENHQECLTKLYDIIFEEKKAA